MFVGKLTNLAENALPPGGAVTGVGSHTLPSVQALLQTAP